jgi:hypothetical protein
MGVTYELIDAPYPYLCAVYRCRCGEVAVRHAGEAATAPERWDRRTSASGEDDYLCPRCVARAQAAPEDQLG